MNPNLPLKSTLLTLAAALLCSGLQFAGIDALAGSRSGVSATQRVQLPTVVVAAQRDASI